MLRLTPLVWEKLTKKLNWREGDLDLPRFKLAHQAELRGALQQLGMEIAFDRERAEFDGIHTTAFYMDRTSFPSGRGRSE